MIYKFFKNLFPEEIRGIQTIQRPKEIVRLVFLKIGEANWVREQQDEILLIPIGAFNLLGMDTLRNYRQIKFLLKAEGTSQTQITYRAERKWATASAKVYTGVVIALLALLVFYIMSSLLDWDGASFFSGFLLIFLGVLFCIGFLIDYCLLFSKKKLNEAIEEDIVFRVDKIAGLLGNSDLEKVEASIQKTERNRFVSMAKKKAYQFLGVAILETMVFAPLLFLSYLMNRQFVEIYIVLIFLFIVLIPVGIGLLIFYKMSNLPEVLEIEQIEGRKNLGRASWLCFIPGFSIVGIFFAVKSLGQIK